MGRSSAVSAANISVEAAQDSVLAAGVPLPDTLGMQAATEVFVAAAQGLQGRCGGSSSGLAAAAAAAAAAAGIVAAVDDAVQQQQQQEQAVAAAVDAGASYAQLPLRKWRLVRGVLGATRAATWVVAQLTQPLQEGRLWLAE
jgi:hypothetical protein